VDSAAMDFSQQPKGPNSRKLHRSLSSNSLQSMSREELKIIAESARNREEDLQLAATLGMELQREVEDKTEKLREMESLLSKIQAPSHVYKNETKENNETESDEENEAEIDKENDDLLQFFRNHLITHLHQLDDSDPAASPSPAMTSSSLVTSPSTNKRASFSKQRNSISKKKKLTEHQIKGLNAHQLFVEYKRTIRTSLRQFQEKIETKEEEIAKMREQLANLGVKAEDSNHKKLIIQRLQDELEQTQLRAAQREIELKAEMRRLIALSTSLNTSTTQQNGRDSKGSEHFSEVSSDSERDIDSDTEKNTKDKHGVAPTLPYFFR